MNFWGLDGIDEWTYTWLNLNHHSLLLNLNLIYIFYFVIGNVFAIFLEVYDGWKENPTKLSKNILLCRLMNILYIDKKSKLQTQCHAVHMPQM